MSKTRIYLNYATFLRSKAKEDCEDSLVCGVDVGRFVVCDGATTSSYSKEWASLLASHFVTSFAMPQEPSQEYLDRWLEPVQGKWKQKVPWDKLDYFSKRKANMGAHSTLAAVCLMPPPSCNPNRIWVWEETPVSISAHLAGDACVFCIRNQSLQYFFPYKTASEFAASPYAVCSLPHNNESLSRHWKVETCTAEPNDIWVLATDAISAHFLRYWEQGRKEEVLEFIRNISAFPQKMDYLEEYIQVKRGKKELRNDDIALIALCFQPNF